MAGRHHADPHSFRRHSTAIGVSAVLLLVGIPGGTALAHNHLLNPSGACNQSGDGSSPGKSGETNQNPSGKPVGKANSSLMQSNCKNEQMPSVPGFPTVQTPSVPAPAAPVPAVPDTTTLDGFFGAQRVG